MLYDHTKVILSPVIQKVRHGIEELVYDEEAQRYIEIRFVQRNIDHHDHIDEELPFKAKQCTDQDFSRTEATRAIFEHNQLKGLIMYCPDLDHFEQLYGHSLRLDGTREDITQSRIEF